MTQRARFRDAVFAAASQGEHMTAQQNLASQLADPAGDDDHTPEPAQSGSQLKGFTQRDSDDELALAALQPRPGSTPALLPRAVTESIRPVAKALRTVPKAASVHPLGAGDTHSGWLDSIPRAPLPKARPARPRRPPARMSRTMAQVPARQAVPYQRVAPYAAPQVATRIAPAELVHAESVAAVAVRPDSPIPPPPKMPSDIDFEALIAQVPDDDEMLSLTGDSKRRKRIGIMVALAFPLVLLGVMFALSKDAIHEPVAPLLRKGQNGLVNATDNQMRQARELQKIRDQLAKEEKEKKEKAARKLAKNKRRRRYR